MGAEPPLVSRADLLAGMPGRRASTILFAIEGLTAQIVARSRRALATYEAGISSADQERAFFDAVGGARSHRARPRIQDIERYAASWKHLVPEAVDLRAALVRALGERYPLDRRRTPRVRGVLGATDEEVGSAYARLYGQSIEASFVADTGWRERLRWWRAKAAEWLETLPPFWTAYCLTLTETVGFGVLALPIALAGLGPLPGLVLLAFFGFVSTVTVAALVEAITRDGAMRYGAAYFGRLVGNYLGRPGVLVLSIALLALNALALLIAMTGFGTVLAGATGVAPGIWVSLLFIAILIVLRRESLDATVASAVFVGAVNLTLLALLVALGLIHIDADHLLHARVPLFGGVPLDRSVVALVFGVLLAVYFGHTSAGNAARVVLQRDPTGRTLLLGNVAAMATAGVIYGLFVVAVNGAVAPERLAAERGTALTPLAEVAGTGVSVIGAAYATLALGLGALYFALGSYNQVVERLPRPAPAARAAGLAARLRSARFAVAALPALAVFLTMQVLFILGAESFSGALNLVGAIAVPLLGGIFPMLMLAAARRRGDQVPGGIVGPLGHPVVIASVVLVYFGGVLAHAIFIWPGILERSAAALVAIVMAAIVLVAARNGSFRPRTVVELRADEPPGVGARIEFVAAGGREPVNVALESDAGREEHAVPALRIDDLRSMRSAEFRLARSLPRELLVWVHRVQGDGTSQPLQFELESLGAPLPAVQAKAGRLELRMPDDEVSLRLRVRESPG